MDVTRKARRSDSLYYGEVSRRELCDIVANVESENAELRELVRRLISHVEHPPCEGCMAEMNCDCSDLTQCDEWPFMVADARKLGIEVSE